MDSKTMKELRDYYDNTSQADHIAEAELNTETVQSPMVGITVRLPAELLEQVRILAANNRMKTTALIRQWIEHAAESAPAPTTEDRGQQEDSATVLAVSGDWPKTPPALDHEFRAIASRRYELLTA